MAKVILICGKICSGKTRYCRRLQAQSSAVLLSCDEIEDMIFHHALGEKHDAIALDIQGYLHKKAEDIIAAGTDVILDWGFWRRAERARVSAYYKSRGIAYQWHYIDVSDADWAQNIAMRNKACQDGTTGDYYVDDGLLAKINALFEPPERAEMDVWVDSRSVSDK